MQDAHPVVRHTRTTGAVMAIFATVLLIAVQLADVVTPRPAASDDDAVEVEAGPEGFPDADGDGVRDEAEFDGDTDGDGIADVDDPDDDGDGLLTAAEGPDFEGDGFTGDARDSDVGGTPDYLDPDDDGDGIPTIDEGADPNGDGLPADALDGDGDSAPDYLDPAAGVPSDLSTTTSRVLTLDGVVADSGFGTPESIGDVNGDGVVDLAVGAFADDTAGVDAGAVHVLFMRADGSVADSSLITAGVNGFGGGLLEGGGFGFRIAGVGDINADGVPDMVVSAYRSSRVGDTVGEVWVLLLTPTGGVLDWQVLTTGYGGFAAELGAGDQFGVDLAGVGDMNGDGINDLAVGAWRADTDQGDEGAVHLLYLLEDGKLAGQDVISLTGLEGGAGFGAAVDSVGDLDGNGVADLAVGAIGGDDAVGRVVVLFLEPGGVVTSVSTLTPGSGPVPVLEAGARFGSGVAGLGDVNGDGVGDLAVGAFGAGNDAGAAWLITLDRDGLGQTATDVTPAVTPGDLFGHTIAALGDLGGDGDIDLAVGAPGATATNVHLIEVGAGTAEPAPATEPEPAPESDQSDEVDQIDETGPDGDLDGDGISNGIEGTGDIDADGIVNQEDLDSDGDGLTDAEEGLADSDADGVADFLEIDDDGDGVLTVVEGAGDVDGDGRPNHRDDDSDGDGVSDGVEGGVDPDGDGVPSLFDDDADGDGVPDRIEGAGDADQDGTADFLDTDSDNDGIEDQAERDGDTDGDGLADRVDDDADGDGTLDSSEVAEDVDGDGLPGHLDLDSDNDGIPDSEEGTADTDADGLVDSVDLDADGDGLADEVEGGSDFDGDGVPNSRDRDADGDGLDDGVEGAGDIDDDGIANYLDDDSDGDGLPDADEGALDGNDDGILDFLDGDTMYAAMQVDVVAPVDVAPGESAEFTLQIVNNGPATASATEARIVVPDGLVVDPATAPAGCEAVGQVITCEVGQLEVDQVVERTIQAEVLGASTVREVALAATVQANEGQATTTTDAVEIAAAPAIGAVTEPRDGVQSQEGALVVVIVTVLLCGALIVAMARERMEWG